MPHGDIQVPGGTHGIMIHGIGEVLGIIPAYTAHGDTTAGVGIHGTMAHGAITHGITTHGTVPATGVATTEDITEDTTATIILGGTGITAAMTLGMEDITEATPGQEKIWDMAEAGAHAMPSQGVPGEILWAHTVLRYAGPAATAG